MSAIAAVFHIDGAPGRAAEAQDMLERMAHRSPDGRRGDALGAASLGQGLLRTKPHASPPGPLTTGSSGCWLAADVRLDNRLELIPELGLESSATDEMVVAAAYECWGEECPHRLLGDFAFVVWDPKAQRLFAARDPFGVRPLYYHLDQRTFSCASEFSGLFGNSAIPRAPDRLSAGLFVAGLHVEFDRTLYSGIRPVSPAHAMSIDRRGLRTWPFWQPNPRRDAPKRTEEYVEQFRVLFEQAVRARFVADRPVAVTVSGGLDSSSIASEAERQRRKGELTAEPIHYVRMAFPGLDCDERAFSQLVADRWGVELSTVYPMASPELSQPSRARLQNDVYFMPNLLFLEPMLELAAGRGARAVLFGAGSELLQCRTGYEPADDLRHFRLREATRSAGIHAAPYSRRTWDRLARAFVTAFAPERLRSAARKRRRLRRTGRLAPDLAREVSAYCAQATDVRDRLPYSDLVTRQECANLIYGVGYVFLLGLIDRLHARWQLEPRYPFLDRRLVEALLTMPRQVRFGFGPGGEKPLLRAAMAGTLPDAIAARQDFAGFGCYYREAFLAPHGEEVRRLLGGGRAVQQGFLNGRAVQQLLAHPRPDDDYADEVATLTALELWLAGL